MMRVLVACEFSGIVRSAIAERGHDAWSCDLLPTEQPGQHLQCDVRDVLGEQWDMMVAFPPCTYLCTGGANWWYREPGRLEKREEAYRFVVDLLWHCDIEKIAIENPPGYLNTAWRKPDQVVHPWMFGHDKRKPTCLWLKNLPPLMASCVSAERKLWVNNLSNTQDRWKTKSRTFQGIAKAMSLQWS